MKKGEGLSLTTIVIALLALIVLVVLILIFTGKITFFNKGVDDCPPGMCVDSAAKCVDRDLTPVAKNCLDVTGSTKKTLGYCCVGDGSTANAQPNAVPKAKPEIV